MPILPLTARTVATLRAPSDRPRIEYFDAEVPGLSLRITSDGVKTWTLLYRHHGRKRRLTLGRFPDLGLGKARLRATEERGRVAGGADPATEKRDERATYGDTVGALYDLYKKATDKKRSSSEQRRIFENEVVPAWRHRRVQDITRRDIRMLVDRKAETAPIMANRILARVSRLFSFAVERDWIEANPALRIGKPADERSRDRVLSREELRELWTALHQTEARDADGQLLPRLSQTLNDAFIVMLLTAQSSVRLPVDQLLLLALLRHESLRTFGTPNRGLLCRAGRQLSEHPEVEAAPSNEARSPSGPRRTWEC